MSNTPANKPQIGFIPRLISLFNPSFANQAQSSDKFPLLRYFFVSSLLVFIVIMILLGLFSRRASQSATENIITTRQNFNVALTRSFANALLPEIETLMMAVEANGGIAAGADSPEITRLHALMSGFVQDSTIIKIKIYNPDGLTIYSSEFAQIGEDRSDNPRFLAAVQGEVVSDFERRDSFNAFEGVIEDVNVVSSYLPVYDDAGALIGIFEVYDNMTAIVGYLQQTRTQVATLLLGLLVMLHLSLFWLIRRAAVIVDGQYDEIQTANVTLTEQQKDIERNTQRYRELVENISDIVYQVDIQGYFTFVSPSASLLTGYPEQQLIGMHFTELVEPSSRQELIEHYTQQIQERQPETTILFPTITAQGETLWVEQKTSLTFDDAGKPQGFQSVVRDITERKKTQDKLRALYEMMTQPTLVVSDQLTQALKIGTEILGLDLGIISRIDGDIYAVLYGHSPDNSLQSGQIFDFKQTYCDLAYQADGLVMIDNMMESNYKGHPCYSAFGLETYIGIPLWVNGKRFGTLNFSSPSARWQPFKSIDQDFFILMGQWVSTMLERELAEMRLRNSEEELRSIINNSPVVITKADRDCRIEFTRMPGVDAALLEPIIGQNFLDFMPEEYHAVARSAIERAFDEQITTQYESSAIDPRDNTAHWYITNIAPIIQEGRVVSALLINNDITERKQTEEVIQQNQAQMRQIADSLNGAIYEFSAMGETWTMNYISDGVEKLTGISAAHATEDIFNLVNVFHPDDIPRFMQSVNDVIRQRGSQWEFEGRLRHEHTGDLRWFRAESRLDTDVHDRALFKGVMLDITERKQFEDSLRLNTRAVEASPGGIVIADVQQQDMPLIYVNPTFEAMTGYAAHEAVGRNCRFLQGDDQDQPALNILRSALKQGKDCVVILRNYRKDGTLFWNELSITPIFDEYGVMTHFLGIQNDITNRIQAETALKQRDAVLQAVASSSTALLQQDDWQKAVPTVLETLGMATGVNRSFIFKKQPDTPEGTLIVSMPYEWVAEGVQPDIDNPLLQNLPLSEIAPRWAELVSQKQIISGFTKDFAENERAILNDDVVFILIIPIFIEGELWGALGFDDCTGTHEWINVEIKLLQSVADSIGAAIAGKQAEQQIQAQNESLVKANREIAVARKQAEAASKLKSQFLATMSHELRTPLNAVIGYSQLQLAGMAGEMTEEQYGFQERILANAQHLLQLINEVLDLSKIEAGRLELVEKPFSLNELLEEIMTQNQVLAEAKGLRYELSVDDRLPEILMGDRGRIKQVIINLVSNAIKFTDEGSVTVETTLYNKDNWRITVTDTGSGISATMQETIFDEFRQAENGIDKGGTGLGLAIVRKLVLMMGGNIRLSSEVGNGSIFTITLPLITEATHTTDPLEA